MYDCKKFVGKKMVKFIIELIFMVIKKFYEKLFILLNLAPISIIHLKIINIFCSTILLD